jgi:hypothetical protein
MAAVMQAIQQQLARRATLVHDSPPKFIQSTLTIENNNVLKMERPTKVPGHLKWGQRHFTDDAVEMALIMNLRAMGPLMRKTTETVVSLHKLRHIAKCMDPPCDVEKLRWMLRVCLDRKHLLYQQHNKNAMRRLARNATYKKNVKINKALLHGNLVKKEMKTDINVKTEVKIKKEVLRDNAVKKESKIDIPVDKEVKDDCVLEKEIETNNIMNTDGHVLAKKIETGNPIMTGNNIIECGAKNVWPRGAIKAGYTTFAI